MPKLVLVLAIAAALVMAITLTSLLNDNPSVVHYSPASSSPRYAVSVAGNLVGAVSSETEISRIINNIKGNMTKEAIAMVDLDHLVQVRAVGQGEKVTNVETSAVERELARHLPSMTQGFAITVNDRDVVGVADKVTADAVVAELKGDYQAAYLQNAEKIEALNFDELVGGHPKLLLVDNVKTKEQAKNILRRGTDRLLLYTVQRGDTVWGIARSRGLGIEDVQKANPGIDPEMIQPGQEINLVVAEPFIHMSSIEQETYTEGIGYPVEYVEDPKLWPFQERVMTEGVPGQRQLTVKIQRKDGRELSRQVIGTKVLSQPKRAVVAKGTKKAPDRGTGSFLWPLDAGEISSFFGPRWDSWHPGIDIATPQGTPIHAADSGTVVFTGWYGNYGNAVLVDLGHGKVITLYGHLSAFAVDEGQQINKGDVIGYVGSTGYSTGPHLHFEVRVNGTAVDPLQYYP